MTIIVKVNSIPEILSRFGGNQMLSKHTGNRAKPLAAGSCFLLLLLAGCSTTGQGFTIFPTGHFLMTETEWLRTPRRPRSICP